MKPIVHILYAPGINCHFETMEAFRLAGAEPRLCNLTSDLITGRIKLTDCDLLAVPGGFSFGDHIAAGRIFALDMISRLKDQLHEVKEKQIPVIGICNGFQILINTGLLPGHEAIGDRSAIVDRNASATFESRWIKMYVQESDCVWTKGMEGEELLIPVAHGEGRLRVPDGFSEKQTVFRYGAPEGTMVYPDNPNGAEGARAGICDPTGRILGVMPHPERAIYPWLESDDGLKIFQTGVAAVR